MAQEWHSDTLGAPVQVLATLLPVRLPADVPGKWAPVTHVETQMDSQVVGFF